MSQARDLPSSVEIVPGRVPHCSSSYRSSPSCATDPDPDDEDGEDGQFNAKQIPKQIPTRAIVCLGALSLLALGVLATVMGVDLHTSWMSVCFGGHANEVAVSSVVLGLFAALLSLLGFVGALVHERACLCLFGPIVLLLFLIAAGGLSVITNAQRVLDDWERHSWRLHDPSSESLHTLYIGFGAAYAFCAPTPAGVGSAIASLDGQVEPPPSILSCRQGSSAPFAAWVNAQCLEPARFRDGASIRPLDLWAEIGACRRDVAAAQSSGAFGALVASDVGDTAWIFCACARPLKTTLELQWFHPGLRE
jgi:hypothetical protein